MFKPSKHLFYLNLVPEIYTNLFFKSPNQNTNTALDSAAGKFAMSFCSVVLPTALSSSIIPQLQASTPTLYSSFIMISSFVLHQLPLSTLVFSSPQFVELLLTAPLVADSAPGSYLYFMVLLVHTKQVIPLKLSHNNYLYWRMQMKPYLLG